jgi:hypothetical protein
MLKRFFEQVRSQARLTVTVASATMEVAGDAAAAVAAAQGMEGRCQVAARMEGGCPTVAAVAGMKGGSMPGSGGGGPREPRRCVTGE